LRRGHNKERCKICQLEPSIRAEVEKMIEEGKSLRKIANHWKELGFSYGGVNRHKKYMFPKVGENRNLDKKLNSYIKRRSGRWTTTSLLIEKDILRKLRKKVNISLSMTINWLIYRWLRKNAQKENKILELADNIFQHRITCSWIQDQRRRLKNAIRKSITLDRDTRRMLNTILRERFGHVEETKEEDGYWIRHPGEWSDTLVWPSHTIAQTGSLSELINGILRLALEIKKNDQSKNVNV